MTFNGNRYQYHSGSMMNHLQPGRYCTSRQGQKLAYVFPTYFILCSVRCCQSTANIPLYSIHWLCF